MAARRIAIMPVCSALLRDVLKLPKDTMIIGATMGPQLGTVEILVEHPDLKPVPEGNHIPTVNAHISWCAAIPAITLFEGWGQSEDDPSKRHAANVRELHRGLANIAEDRR